MLQTNTILILCMLIAASGGHDAAHEGRDGRTRTAGDASDRQSPDPGSHCGPPVSTPLSAHLRRAH